MFYALTVICLTVAVCNWIKWKITCRALTSLMQEKGCVPTNEEIKAHSTKAIKSLFKTKL